LISIEQLIRLRTIIGYLGEKKQYNWWPSSFYSPSSDAFLDPVFTRTQAVARSTGVSRAASRVHDEYIGIGAVYHLFRLPERFEHRIVAHLQHEENEGGIPTAQEAALAWMREYAVEISDTTVGPVRVGSIKQLQNEKIWREVAALYLYAFEMDTRIYPYFRDATK
jgi:hypothetical protein